MNKTQTKIDAERYVAPNCTARVIVLSRRIMQTSGFNESSSSNDGAWVTEE